MSRRLASLAPELSASLVVFLIAFPLSLGIALASDAPLLSGVIAAIVGGVVVGAIGGAPLQVSGPAAGLTVLVFGLVEQMGGDWRAVCSITVAAGLLQVALGGLRVARLALAISPAVIHGMLAGIGILILLGQLHVVLGGTPQSSAWKNLGELPAQIRNLHGWAAGLGALTLAILCVWPRLPWKAARAVPNALAGVLLVTALSIPLGSGVARVSLGGDAGVRPIVDGHVVEDAPALPAEAAGPAGAKGAPASLWSAIKLPALPTDLPIATLLGAVIALTLIASVESLLCAVATDKLHTGPRANLDRELIGQGIGNTISGLLGGLPITGVIVRSSANVAAGATTRLSAILHGFWVLLFVAQLAWAIEWIPKAVLAALLVHVGARLVSFEHIRDLKRHGELPIYLATVAGVVGRDLLFGVGAGLALAVARLLYRMARVRIATEERDGKWHVVVNGSLTFLGVPKLSAALETLPPAAHVDVDLDADFIDHAGFEALHVWRVAYEKQGGRVDIDELHEAWSPAPGRGRLDGSGAGPHGPARTRGQPVRA